jgi:hypothetical protein
MTALVFKGVRIKQDLGYVIKLHSARTRIPVVRRVVYRIENFQTYETFLRKFITTI